jgi:hypothetical protein
MAILDFTRDPNRLAVHGLAVARKRHYRRKPTPSLVVVKRVHPDAWRFALDLAGGDRRRLRVLPDASVLVINKPR